MGQRSSMWKEMDAAGLSTDFPILIEEEICNITLGTYQMKMPKAYSHEQLQEDGAHDILIAEDVPNIVGTKIRSRHFSAINICVGYATVKELLYPGTVNARLDRV